MNSNTVSFTCPVCGSNDYKTIKQFDNGVVVGKCKQCNLLYTPERDQTPEDLFKKTPYELMKFLFTPILTGKVKHFRDSNFREYLRIIQKYATGKTLLDIGCAHGIFTQIARDGGFDVSCIEPNENMHRFAKEELGLDAYHGTFDEVDLNQRKWDVVSFTDSFEYFTEALPTLTKLKEKHLNDNGIVFIKVPNGDYFLMRHTLKTKYKISMGSADAFSPPKRVCHYTAETLKTLIEKSGLHTLVVKHIAPVDSPVWPKYIGMNLEFKSPFCLSWKQKIFRRFLHGIGIIEFVFTRKNHFSQSVYIIAAKNKPV